MRVLMSCVVLACAGSMLTGCVGLSASSSQAPRVKGSTSVPIGSTAIPVISVTDAVKA